MCRTAVIAIASRIWRIRGSIRRPPRGAAGAGSYDCGVIARAHRASFIAVVTLGLLAAGCGSTDLLVRSTPPGTRKPPKLSSPPTTVPLTPLPDLPGMSEGAIPAPGPTGIRPAGTDVAVIRAWSDALRRGDVRGAARYFALPSVMVNGTDASGGALIYAIDSRAEAVSANASLPCGAQLISADQRGRYVNALFRLTGRSGPGGSDCGTGVGETARTNFVIAHGLIVEWIRAPDDPGDNGGSAGPAPVPATPETLPPSAPTV